MQFKDESYIWTPDSQTVSEQNLTVSQQNTTLQEGHEYEETEAEPHQSKG